MTAAEAAARAALMGRTTHAFEHEVGAPPTWCWFVPGRIEIFGKHTDYAGGESLLCAVPRGFAVVARPRTDDQVRVIDARHGESVVISVHDAVQVWRGWANYAAVTIRRLAADFPGAALGADIAIASDLPRAAGLSSSSALVVGIATAVIRRAGLEARDDWRAVIASVEDLASYLGCVENGYAYKSLAGMGGVGTLGGSQDHTAILACRPGHVSHYGFLPVRALGVAMVPAAWRFVVATSGVHADKAGSVRERYNRASLAVRALLDVWNDTASSRTASLAEALTSEPDAEARLRQALGRRPAPGFTADDLARRLSQLVRELARIPVAAAAFAAADAAALSVLSQASQRDAEDLLGNQIPETVALCDLARREGALAASAFGAGFGGSVWALVPATVADAFGAVWMQRYHQQFPHRPAAEWFSATAAPGVVEMSSEAISSAAR